MLLSLFFDLKREDETISIIHAWVAQHTDFMGSACVISVICICALSNFTLTQFSICCQACCLLQVAAAVSDFSFKGKSSYFCKIMACSSREVRRSPRLFLLGVLGGHDYYRSYAAKRHFFNMHNSTLSKLGLVL